jgi:hypothetical protein
MVAYPLRLCAKIFTVMSKYYMKMGRVPGSLKIDNQQHSNGSEKMQQQAIDYPASFP